MKIFVFIGVVLSSLMMVASEGELVAHRRPEAEAGARLHDHEEACAVRAALTPVEIRAALAPVENHWRSFVDSAERDEFLNVVMGANQDLRRCIAAVSARLMTATEQQRIWDEMRAVTAQAIAMQKEGVEAQQQATRVRQEILNNDKRWFNVVCRGALTAIRLGEVVNGVLARVFMVTRPYSSNVR